MKKKNITVAKLNELLTEDQQGLGSDRALHTKISRGNFSADWFLDCMRLMKIKKIDIKGTL